MSDIFIKIFNLGVSAGWFVLAILICRPLMSRVPRWINCLLWGIVGLRLCLPFSLESIFSLVPSAEPLPQDIALSPAPEINSGVSVLNDAINPIISTSLAPTVGASVNPMQIVIAIASWIWIAGIALMLGYGIVSYITLRIKVRVSVKGADGVYFCDEVDSPFILGVIRPRICVPSGMSGNALDHVLAHEKAHLSRGDHLWKPIGFAFLAFYWFNPLLWVAYALLCRDIEAACDEKVIKTMPSEAKKSYSEALLACSLHRKRIMACPLAFGEVGVKERIKMVLNYKKPAFWVIIAALVVTLVLSVCFLTVPQGRPSEKLTVGSEWGYVGEVSIHFAVEKDGAIRGYLDHNEKSYDITVHTRSAGLVRGTRLWVEIFKGDLVDAEITENDLLLSGSMRARGDKLIFEISEDNLGLQIDKKLVFKQVYDMNMIGSNGKVYIPAPSNLDYMLYVKILDCGFLYNTVDVNFVQAQRDENDIVFVLEWKNRGLKPQSIGPSFEVYRYDGVSLAPLEHIHYWQMNVIAVDAFSRAYRSYNITEHYDISAPGKYRFECNGAWIDFEVVREIQEDLTQGDDGTNYYVFDPSYYAYDSSRKYDVYVWQMAKGSFSFALLESKPRDWLDDELWDLKGVDATDMRRILLNKNLGPNDVNIVPWQNPLSSYIGDYGMNWIAMEDSTPQRNLYLAMVHDMLFGAAERVCYPSVYESTYFDIDGDGVQEYNKIALGLDGDKFTLRYMISEDGKTLAYDDTYEITPMSVKLYTDEGNLRLRGVTEDGAAHTYAIALEDGHVKLIGIEDTKSCELIKKLDLSEIDLSLVDRIVVTNGQTGKRAYLNKWLDKVLFQTILDTVKKIEANDPVSSRGYYGFTYHVELYYDYQPIYSFSLCPEGDGASITCGYYETVGGFDYPARYKLTEPTYDHLAAVLGNCFK